MLTFPMNKLQEAAQMLKLYMVGYCTGILKIISYRTKLFIMDNKTFVQKWYDEVWNKKNEKAIYEMFSPTGIAHGLLDDDGNEIIGPGKFADFFKKFIASFPDIFVRVDDVISEGEKAVSRCTVSCSHSGSSFQAGKSFAPTNKKTEFSGIAITVIRNGQIQEGWNNFDFLTMYSELGLI